VQESVAKTDFVFVHTENVSMLSQKCPIIFRVRRRTFQTTHLPKFLSNRSFICAWFTLSPLGLSHLIDLVGVELERLSALKIVHLPNDLPSGKRYWLWPGVENFH
jgi:hypothetical protein